MLQSGDCDGNTNIIIIILRGLSANRSPLFIENSSRQSARLISKLKQKLSSDGTKIIKIMRIKIGCI